MGVESKIAIRHLSDNAEDTVGSVSVDLGQRTNRRDTIRELFLMGLTL